MSLASEDDTSDNLSLASEDNTSDNLSLASEDNTSDTLTLARLDRENQGPWEAEYSYGGEADLHGQFIECSKNPGHKNFIPVDKFRIEDLPEDYRHNYVFDYIREVAELTVRVTVKNVSGGAAEPTLVSLEMLPLDKGSWKDHFCCLTEDDETNKHYAACKKNPGHQNFFPLEKFDMDSLPPVCERGEIVKCIKLLSDLTVRVTVNYVSEERPETVRGTDIPYPWFSNRGSNLMRVGSGWVEGVERHTDDDCHCKECQNSPKPQRQFAWIRIKTATHLVYDKMEAERTTCDLFFDSGETPDVCKDVITLTDMYTFYKNTVRDACTIEYCTHDMDLAWRLECMTSRYRTDFYAPNMCGDIKSMKSVKQNGGGQTKPETPLNIVVSHPHGCAKQVSIGHYDIPGNDGTEAGQCSIGNLVCPGSSGAPILLLSRRILYPCL